MEAKVPWRDDPNRTPGEKLLDQMLFTAQTAYRNYVRAKQAKKTATLLNVGQITPEMLGQLSNMVGDPKELALQLSALLGAILQHWRAQVGIANPMSPTGTQVTPAPSLPVPDVPKPGAELSPDQVDIAKLLGDA